MNDPTQPTPPGGLGRLFAASFAANPDAAVLEQLRRECAALGVALFQPGDVIGGRYEVRRTHHGGFGAVYICRFLGPEQYARGGNLVALKTPLPRHLADPEMRELFLGEAAHCVALGPHPNLVLAYGVEEHNRLPFIVLENIPGARSLADDIVAGATDWRGALRVGLGLARGLEFAGLVHGDLKPVNVLLGPDGAAKAADFGLSLTTGEAADPRLLAGTRGFLAPEMLAGRTSRSVAADIYAFGVTLYAAATRCLPFPADSSDRNLTEPAPDPREIAADIPAEFAGFLLCCLEREPARRPANFAEIARDLGRLHRRLLGAEPSADPAPDAPARADALVNAAQTWINLGQPAKALAAARDAVEAAPNNWKAHNALGLAQLETGAPTDAARSFARAAQLAPAELAPRGNSALAAWQAGDKSAARDHLVRAAKLARDAGRLGELDSVSQLAVELLEERDAYNFVHAVLTANPGAALTWNNRAILMRRMGAFDQALESATRALALNPAYAKAYVQKANALLELRRFAEGLDAAERALALDPALAGAYTAAATALAQLGRLPAARARLAAGLRHLPAHPLLLRAQEMFAR
jgi:tetratricopeptide (TPR) repeat protein